MKERAPLAGAYFLDEMVSAQKQGAASGICSICSANPTVLRAAVRHALEHAIPLLIESTSNQVNQFGGYTGQVPTQFSRTVVEMAERAGLPSNRLILGGDHLGPNPWQKEPAEAAMVKARKLVADCVRAGYLKIHLDASMSLGGDPPDSPAGEVSAGRAAALCQASESTWQKLGGRSPAPRYIIGTEVPPPGGEVGVAARVQATSVSSARQTLELTRAAFHKVGLDAAWERVIGLVVQPGVEFGDRTIHPYQHARAADLAWFIERVPGIIYEAHSTDYQSPRALRELVRDHFAILKVGPALTFAFREAMFALENIEIELFTGSTADQRSHLQDTIEAEMLTHPEHWQRYYPGAPAEQRLMRRFSLSDRIRYYWPRPAVQAAQERLLANLSQAAIPPGLANQFFPDEVDLSGDPPAPDDLIYRRIRRVLEDYRAACIPA
ncbi:MAG TPA: class II D-tagatose-bisphosphate aldolase, non-catalytic subunit [Anaerolineaceae bacterium]|nr:class II D-tagatose-bisphosphate aldolase, non-catalytic subunit [Anaerolineaceae bacterium]